MKRIIKRLIRAAETSNDIETKEAILKEVKDLINEFAITFNCPSNWQDIAEELEQEYKNNHDIYEALHLYEYEN